MIELRSFFLLLFHHRNNPGSLPVSGAGVWKMFRFFAFYRIAIHPTTNYGSLHVLVDGSCLDLFLFIHQTIVRCGNCFDFIPPIRELLSIHFPAMVPSLRWWINIVLICFCSSNILPWGVETVLIFWIAIHPFSSHGSLPAVAPAPVAVCRPLRAEPQCW